MLTHMLDDLVSLPLIFPIKSRVINERKVHTHTQASYTVPFQEGLFLWLRWLLKIIGLEAAGFLSPSKDEGNH